MSDSPAIGWFYGDIFRISSGEDRQGRTGGTTVAEWRSARVVCVRWVSESVCTEVVGVRESRRADRITELNDEIFRPLSRDVTPGVLLVRSRGVPRLRSARLRPRFAVGRRIRWRGSGSTAPWPCRCANADSNWGSVWRQPGSREVGGPAPRFGNRGRGVDRRRRRHGSRHAGSHSRFVRSGARRYSVVSLGVRRRWDECDDRRRAAGRGRRGTGSHPGIARLTRGRTCHPKLEAGMRMRDSAISRHVALQARSRSVYRRAAHVSEPGRIRR